MKQAEKNFGLSINQKQFWFSNKNNFKRLYTQISVKFLVKVQIEELMVILNRITDIHETLSSRLVLDKNSIFPLQNPSHHKEASIEIFSSDGYEDWITVKQDGISESVLETDFPIRFFLFSDGRGNVTNLVYRVYSFWTDLYGGFKILDNIHAALTNNQLPIPGDEGFIIHRNFAAWQNELLEEKDNEGMNFWLNYSYDSGKKIIPFGKKLSSEFQPVKICLYEITGANFSTLLKSLEKSQINLELKFLSSVIDFAQNYEKGNVTLGYNLFERVYDVLNETVGLISKAVPLEVNEDFDINSKKSIRNLNKDIEKIKNWSDYFGSNSFDENSDKNRFKLAVQYIETALPLGGSTNSSYVIEDVFSAQDTFEVKFSVINLGDRLKVEMYYDTNMFNNTEIMIMRDQFGDSLRKVFNASFFPDNKSGMIPSILKNLNGVDNYQINLDCSVLDLIREHVQHHPDFTAIQSDFCHITYMELWKKTNSLANYLIDTYGPVKGKPIAILLHNPIDYVVSILAILKAGAFFVPLDSSMPDARINFILQDCNCGIVITENAFTSIIDFSGKILYYEKLSEISVDPDLDPKVSSEIAYVIYTSGSSGFPKGVKVSHRSFTNYISWAKEYYLEANDLGNSALFSSFSFDLTLTSIFLPLINGKVIFIPDEKLPLSEKLIRVVENPKIDVIKLTPAHINLLSITDLKIEDPKIIICGGEALTIHHVQLLHKAISNVRIYNEYGPTEATVGCIVKQISNEEDRILIGKPISNAKIKITRNDMPCSVGCIGEILIGGECLSLGYVNSSETAKRFFIDEESSGRFYRSGDLGRLLPDGNIEYIGRNDDQVKIRGYRIELGEIEHVLMSHKEIDEAVVLAWENQTKEKELVAYVKARSEQRPEELSAYLKESLPEYMIPVHYILLEEFPLTANGKIDKRSLPDPDNTGLSGGAKYVAPRNETEEKLVAIWEEILKREHIGVEDNFFALGGHSLKALRLSNEYQKELAVKISLIDLFSHNTIASHAEFIRTSKRSEFLQIEKVNEQESYPISDAQRRLWVLSQFEEGSVAYNMPVHVYLNENINIDFFKQAINDTIDRHEILRTVFRADETGEVRQWIVKREDLGFMIDYVDFRKNKTREKKVKEYIESDSFKVFDLANGPLLRAGLLQIEDNGYVFYFNMHHIISDGWSMEVMKKDVFTFYESYSGNAKARLSELRIQYKDYAVWQIAQLEEDSFKSHKSYWIDSLKGELPLLDLPSTRTRPKIKTHNGQRLRTYIDKTTTDKLKKYSESHGGSLFIGLLSAWNILMSRYTGQNDIVIGTPVAGREHADLKDQIGFYVNTLALRNKIDPEENFNEVFSRIKQNSLNAYSHQMYPFDRLVDELKLARDTSRSVVFDVMLVLQNNGERTEELYPIVAELTEEDPLTTQLDQIVGEGYVTSKFDLTLSIREIEEHMLLQLVYNSDVYEREMVEGLIKHYKRLINALLEKPEVKISRIEYLSPVEKEELLFTFNDTGADYSKTKTIVNLFEEQVERTPDNIAVVFEKTALTYREINERSNQLAAFLKKNYDIKPDDLIGIRQERSEWMIISILGILKTGGAYLPIGVDYPKDRVDYIVTDSKCKIVIDGDEIDRFRKSEKRYSSVNSATINKPDDLLYVIYTSGSTGKPKGVMVEHRNMVNYIYWFISKCRNQNTESTILLSDITFDGVKTALFGSLLSGGTLHVISKEMLYSPVTLAAYIKENKISFLKIIPSLLKLLIADQESFDMLVKSVHLQLIVVGGESVNGGDLRKIKQNARHIKIINHYGPTETTVGVITQKVEEIHSVIPIGHPINNSKIYITDANQLLQPIGIPGEICISGDGVTRGYLNNPHLTSDKFVPDPFNPGKRMYRTGDIGRWRKDGCIEFMGRKDDQIKIHGHRIELGEIEHALLKNEQIDEAVVVLTRESENASRELVAYIVSKSTPNRNDLRSYLKELLPEYMLPAYYVQLKALPLTSNGKTDKKSLPDPQGLGVSSGEEYVAPVTEQEKVLASVWSDVLKREGIGIRDNFYNLGGDSIKSIQVVARLKQRGYILKVEHILRTPVLEELIQFMQEASYIVDQSAVTGAVELTPIQKRFFEDPLIKQYDHFNQFVLLKSKEELDGNILEKSLKELTKHHDALRMVYKRKKASWEQINQDTKSKSFTLDFYDLRDADNPLERMAELGESLQSSIELSKGPLLRVGHFRLNDGDRLGLIIHHLVVDGVSWRILLEDLSTLYISYKAGKKASLPFKTDSFQKWSLLQKKYANEERFLNERDYWEELCSMEIECLPKDKEAKQEMIIMDSSESFSLDERTTELLQTRVHRVYNTAINDVLLTGLGLAIKEVFSTERCVLKMEGHGREDIVEGVDINRTVGWFTTIYPFVLDVSKSLTEIENLVGVKEALRRVPKRGIGYGILKYLSQEALMNEIKPEISFNYLGDFGNSVALIGEDSLFDYTKENIGSGTAKENGSDTMLEVSGMLVMGELSMSIRYSKSVYNSKTIQKLINSYKKNLKSIIKELSERKNTYLTPSDLSFKQLKVEDVSRLNSDNMLEDVYELSPLQEGIYFHWLSEESNALYFEQTSYKVKAKGLNIENVKHAYDGLVARHGVLRTSFSSDYAGRCLQIIRKEVPSNFTYEKIEDKKDKQQYIQIIKKRDIEKGFDLSSPSQMRLHIIDLGDFAYEFIWSHHHILMDGWCMSILINDFNQLLSYETMGTTLDMLPVMPYSNYINWLKTVDKKSSLGYWRHYLADYSHVAEIPFKIKTEERAYIESKEHLLLDGELFNKVNALCNRSGITQNTFIQGVWGFLLSHYNNTSDVVFGAVVSGRPAELPGVEDMVGLFSNTIPVRVSYKSEDTPFTLLKALQEQFIRGTSHHYLNLSEVQSQSGPGMSLINHIMVFENYAVKELMSEGVLNTHGREGISIESFEIFEQTNYDFSIVISPSATSLNIDIRYDVNRYDSSSIKLLREHIGNLINGFAESPDKPLHTLDYLSQEEKDTLLCTFNTTEVDFPREKTIVDLFEEQVEKTPDNVAVVFEQNELTYRELDERSNQLASYLQKNYDIKPDDLIGIKQERSEWMMISILGVLKAGGAYVPIDPNFPKERIDYIENDTRCKVCLEERELEKFRSKQKSYSKAKIPSDIKADNLVYVIYTSGSTGQPKGVLLEYRGVVNRLLWMRRDLKIDEQDIFLQKTPTTFDVSVWELFLPLICGSKLVVAEPQRHKDPAYLEQIIEGSKVSIIHFVPSMLNGIMENVQWSKFESLRHVICSGEALSKRLELLFKEKSRITKLHNYYGPTEASVDVTAIDLMQFPTTRNEVSIGRPVDNTSIYIVNEMNNLQPIGVLGEILIAGEQIARGYLNKPELTAEKFVGNPFNPDQRSYRTGDLGRWLPDGRIEFLGRKDEQVKIRGYRIELGEIEHALQNHKDIEEVVVLARTNKNEEKELVAYITGKGAQNITALRSYLKDSLPDYMLPSHFVQMEEFPLTASGKVDKRALPDPQGLGIASGVNYVAPRTEQEKVLAFVWEDVLKRKGIGVKDNFFNLGGDSIKSIQVVSRLKQKGYALKVEQVLRIPVLEELSRVMKYNIRITEQSEVKGRVELTPIQKWFFTEPKIKVHHYFNQSVLLSSKDAIDPQSLEKSIHDLTIHHDALRMVYKIKGDKWEQLNQDTISKSYTIDFYDLSHVEDAPDQMLSIGEQLQASIDLSKGPLFRVVHFRLLNEDRVGLIIHHLVVDGISWRILLEDLSNLYNGYQTGKKAGLPLKTDSFQQWASFQKEYAKGKKIQKERAYWQSQCSNETQRLPQDKKLKKDEVIIDARASFNLDKATTELLQTQVHGVYNTEVNDVLLTGLGLAIKEVFLIEKCVLKMEGHGREEIIDGIDVSRTVGWFTTLYPFVLDVSEKVNQTEVLIGVKEALRKVPNKGIGYGILHYLSDEKIVPKVDPEIVFNYLGDFDGHTGGTSDSVFQYASESIGSGSAKANDTDALLDVSGILVQQELRMSIRYSKSRYKSETIKKLISSYEKHLKSLIKELSGSKHHYLTPSDLSFKGLSLEELRKINSDQKVEDVYELSPLQEGIYYNWLSEGASPLYFEQLSYVVKAKDLSIQELKNAYDSLISRHGVLRTRFSNEYAERTLQIVSKEVPSSFAYEKVESEVDKEIYLQKIKRQDREKGFDLSGPSQMRLHIIELSEGMYEFIWGYHHILMDGWCLGVLINDFNEMLSAEIMGTKLNLPPVMPYSNYINWLATVDKEASSIYWKAYLEGYSQVAEIPFKIKTGDNTYVEFMEELRIEGEPYRNMNALCNQLGITQNTFMQAVWGYLLSRYNNTNDVVFGTVVSGRPAELTGVEDMIGLFSNTIPVRIKYESDQTPAELLKILQDQAIQSTPHHYMSLSDVQSQSELGKKLIDHIMLFQNYAVKELTSEGVFNTQREEGLRIEAGELVTQGIYDLNMSVETFSSALNIKIRYNGIRYEGSSLKRIISHLDKLIAAFAMCSDQPLNTLDYLSQAEKSELLVTFNDTVATYPKDKTIIDLFEEQVEKTPDDVALVFEKTELTYKELDALSNKLANCLRETYNITADDLVGIQLDRSEWMIVAILGVLKASGAYVPIDPDYPSSRKEHIVKDSCLKLLITEVNFIYGINYYDGPVFTIDAEFDAGNYRSEKLSRTITSRNLAYVIYTSGSTGQPKGVLVEHRNLVHSTTSRFSVYQRPQTFLLLSSISFDSSVAGIFGTLVSGGKLVVTSINAANLDKILEVIERNGISQLLAVPSLYKLILSNLQEKPNTLRIVTVAGEECPRSLVDLHHSSAHMDNCELYNEYGPTEYTVWASYHKYKKTEPFISTIGKPISNTQIYILGDEKELQPLGVIGEIYISGAGVARGYLNQPVLTKGKFISNPYKADERLYKTGDLGRWTKDGNIEFIGRKDDQVKVRGYRIELGEIEYALLKNKEIEAAVVVVRENQHKEKELVAYITSMIQQNINDLGSYLKELLPEYMLPTYYVQLDSIPLSSNGKIDRKLLPDPEGLALTGRAEYVAARDEVEEKLVMIWKEVLKKEKIGIRDDFFALGGHSLKLVKMINKINRQFDLKYDIESFYTESTIELMSQKIKTDSWFKESKVEDENNYDKIKI